MIKILKITFALLLVTAGFAFADSQRYVRVAIFQDTPSLSLKIKGSFEIRDLTRNKIIHRSRNINATVTVNKDGIAIGNIRPNSNNLLVEPNDPESLIINGRLFRGNIQFVRKDNAKLLVINHIDLEDYVKGILYHESSHYWPIEALKAQAIISRSYALYQMQENKAKDFDMTSDIYSQVYGGKTSERYRTNKAVDETKDEAIFFEGKLMPAYFHATCGGHTEDAALLWNIDLAPLKGVACPFCKESPHFNWHYDMALKEMEKKLSAAGSKIEDTSEISIIGKDKSGRITDLKIISQSGEIRISAKDFRNIIGPNIIRSTNFSVSIAGKDVFFEGIGWGHGVGLCQWGAYFMAKNGRSVDEILKYYYPGINVKAF